MTTDVFSFWTGDKSLHYIHLISLLSHVKNGYNVTLFVTTGVEKTLNVPSAINLCNINEIIPDFEARTNLMVAATQSDLFRIIGLKQNLGIWIDTDVLSIKRYPENTDHIYATEAPRKIENTQKGNLNNAVLYLSEKSKGLDLLNQFAGYSLGLEQSSMNMSVLKYADDPSGHPILHFGPRALTHFLRLTDELQYQLPPAALYPVHFNVSDCFWDPLVNVEERFTKDTLSVHLWASQIRSGWYRRTAEKGSFIWKAAKELGVDMEANRYGKKQK